MLGKLNLHDYLQLLALIVSVVNYRKLAHTPFSGFFPLLTFTVLVEWGSAYRFFIINGSNHWIFNLLTTASLCFFLYLFSFFFKPPRFRSLARLSIPLFLLSALVNMFLIQGFNRFHTYTFVAGSLLIIVFSCLYFYQLLQSPHEMKLLAIPFFWITTGLFFFYAGQFVVMAIFPFLAYANDKAFAQLFNAIVNNLNILLYCCFIVAFLCNRETSSYM